MLTSGQEKPRFLHSEHFLKQVFHGSAGLPGAGHPVMKDLSETETHLCLSTMHALNKNKITLRQLPRL